MTLCGAPHGGQCSVRRAARRGVRRTMLVDGSLQSCKAMRCTRVRVRRLKSLSCKSDRCVGRGACAILGIQRGPGLSLLGMALRHLRGSCQSCMADTSGTALILAKSSHRLSQQFPSCSPSSPWLHASPLSTAGGRASAAAGCGMEGVSTPGACLDIWLDSVSAPEGVDLVRLMRVRSSACRPLARRFAPAFRLSTALDGGALCWRAASPARRPMPMGIFVSKP